MDILSHTLNRNWIQTLIRDNVTMSSRSQRIGDGIDKLVRHLLVKIPGEDAASAEDREINAVDFVREVLEG